MHVVKYVVCCPSQFRNSILPLHQGKQQRILNYVVEINYSGPKTHPCLHSAVDTKTMPFFSDNHSCMALTAGLSVYITVKQWTVALLPKLLNTQTNVEVTLLSGGQYSFQRNKQYFFFMFSVRVSRGIHNRVANIIFSYVEVSPNTKK